MALTLSFLFSLNYNHLFKDRRRNTNDEADIFKNEKVKMGFLRGKSKKDREFSFQGWISLECNSWNSGFLRILRKARA